MTEQNSDLARAAEQRAVETERDAAPRTPSGDEQRGMTVRNG